MGIWWNHICLNPLNVLCLPSRRLLLSEVDSTLLGDNMQCRIERHCMFVIHQLVVDRQFSLEFRRFALLISMHDTVTAESTIFKQHRDPLALTITTVLILSPSLPPSSHHHHYHPHPIAIITTLISSPSLPPSSHHYHYRPRPITIITTLIPSPSLPPSSHHHRLHPFSESFMIRTRPGKTLKSTQHETYSSHLEGR